MQKQNNSNETNLRIVSSARQSSFVEEEQDEMPDLPDRPLTDEEMDALVKTWTPKV